jgi:O-antigen ligase
MQLRFGLTMDRIGTREALIKLLTYLVVFFLAQQLFAHASPRVWQFSGIAVAVYTFAMAVFATLQLFASPGLLYGFIRPQWGGSVFGPYVNHNHYAGLMELLIPMEAALALSLRPKHPAKPLLCFAIFVAIVSAFLSGSRSGTIALAVELGIFIAALFLGGLAGSPRQARTSLAGVERQAHNRALIASLALAVLAGCCFFWLDPGDAWKRWEAMAKTPELAAQDRFTMTGDCMRISRSHLAGGIGIGALEVAYPKYQTLATDLLIDYAHDDYAQLLAESGILGWVLLPASVALFAFRAFRRLHLRLQGTAGWLQLGAAVGVCGILVHSFTDFNLHVPANGAWFAASAALATLSPDSD